MYTKTWQVTCVLVLVAYNTSSGVMTSTCQKGWFGPKCEYKCHCRDTSPCNPVDGFCQLGCDREWFGPACQYVSLRFKVLNKSIRRQNWLADKDDSTCNSKNTDEVLVRLRTPSPLDRIRVAVRDPDHLNSLVVSHYGISAPRKRIYCENPRRVKISSTIQDIYCSTSERISRVALSGSGVNSLCSLYISGGRSFAQKQPAGSETDGLYPVDRSNDTLKKPFALFNRCTSTSYKYDIVSWNISFPSPVEVSKFLLIYKLLSYEGNRGLISVAFHVRAMSSDRTDQLYEYSRKDFGARNYSIVIPSPRIQFAVSKVEVFAKTGRMDKPLCEVEIFGDCPFGFYGLTCSKQCNTSCYGSDHACDPFDGTCDSCSPGYTGRQCGLPCPLHKYGLECLQNCSSNCAGQHKLCHHIDGHCTNGCVSGFRGALCDQICPLG
ncbi:hypothetical protein RRG08_025547, partial [Elysia crispata]